MPRLPSWIWETQLFRIVCPKDLTILGFLNGGLGITQFFIYTGTYYSYHVLNCLMVCISFLLSYWVARGCCCLSANHSWLLCEQVSPCGKAKFSSFFQLHDCHKIRIVRKSQLEAQENSTFRVPSVIYSKLALETKPIGHGQPILKRLTSTKKSSSTSCPLFLYLDWHLPK